MWRYASIYGLIAGLIAITIIAGDIAISGDDGANSSHWFGYLVMLLALTLVYFGTRRFRDVVQGGVIGFGKALLVGVMISAVAGLVYAVVWEIFMLVSGIDFFEAYAAAVIEQKKANGLAGEALASEIAKMDALREQYKNLYFRLPVTFSEIFPVGLLVSIISAAMLRTRGPAAKTK